MQSKNIILSVFSLLAFGLVILGSSQLVSAQTANRDDLVKVIAQKFGLDQAQVQTVFDEYRAQHQIEKQQQMQQRHEDKLHQAVSEGKITAEQKQTIINKLSELRDKYSPQSNQNLTPEQRREQMQQKQTELKSWAESQGIDYSLIMMGGFGGQKRGWFKGGPMSQQ